MGNFNEYAQSPAQSPCQRLIKSIQILNALLPATIVLFALKPMSTVNLPRLCLRTAVLLLSVVPLFPARTHAQTVDYGRGPAIQSFPSVEVSSPEYNIDGNTSCPTPSFGITGFTGSGNDWANTYSPIDGSVGTRARNYGAAVSMRIPFGGSLSEFCKQFAKTKADFERVRTENQIRNSQLMLVRQCDFLFQYGWDLTNKGFESKDFSYLLPCREIQAARNPNKSMPAEEPAASTEPFSPQPPIVIERRRGFRGNR